MVAAAGSCNGSEERPPIWFCYLLIVRFEMATRRRSYPRNFRLVRGAGSRCTHRGWVYLGDTLNALAAFQRVCCHTLLPINDKPAKNTCSYALCYWYQ